MDIKLALALNNGEVLRQNDIVSITTGIRDNGIGCNPVYFLICNNYTGRISNIDSKKITLDCSKQFSSELVTINLNVIRNVEIISDKLNKTSINEGE